MTLQCKCCDATVADEQEDTLADARWGWTMAPDPGLGEDRHGPIPGWFYACPDHSDDDMKDAWSYVRKQRERTLSQPGGRKP